MVSHRGVCVCAIAPPGEPPDGWGCLLRPRDVVDSAPVGLDGGNDSLEMTEHMQVRASTAPGGTQASLGGSVQLKAFSKVSRAQDNDRSVPGKIGNSFAGC